MSAVNVNDNFPELLLNVSSQIAEVQKQSEAQLNQIDDATLMRGLVECLHFHHEDANATNSVRRMAAVLLRQNVEKHPKYLKDARFRGMLLESMVKQPSIDLKRHVSHVIFRTYQAIAELKDEWPECMTTLLNMITNGDDAMKQVGLHVVGDILEYDDEVFENSSDMFMTVFTLCMNNTNLPVRIAALDAFSKVLKEDYSLAGTEAALRLVPTVVTIFTETLSICQQNSEHAQKVLQALVEVAEYRATYFNAVTEPMFTIMKKIIEQAEIDTQLRVLALQFVMNIFTSPENILHENPPLQNLAIHLCFYALVSIEDEQEEWAQETDEFDTNDEPLFEAGEIAMDCISENLHETFLSLFSPLIRESVRHEDWRHRHAVMYAVGQISAATEWEHIVTLTELIWPHLEDPSVRTRFAALRTFGIVANDHKDRWTHEYGPKLIPVLVNHMNLTIFPARINSAAVNTLGYVSQYLSENAFPKECYQQTFAAIHDLINQSPSSIVKFKAVRTMGILVTSLEEVARRFYKELHPALVNLIRTSAEKEDYNLCGHALETLISLGDTVGQENFKEPTKELFQFSLALINSNKGRVPDPPDCNFSLMLFDAWASLISFMREEVTPYAEWMLGVLLKYASLDTGFKPDSALEDSVDDVVTIDGKKYICDKSIIQTKISACHCVEGLAELNLPQFKNQFVLIVTPFIKLLESDISSSLSISGEKTLSAIMKNLVKHSRDENNNIQDPTVAEHLLNMCNHLMSSLHEERHSVEVRSTIAKALSECLRYKIANLSPQFSEKLMQSVMKCVTDSCKELKGMEDPSEDVLEEHDMLGYRVGCAIGDLAETQPPEVFNPLFEKYASKVVEEILCSDNAIIQQHGMYVVFRIYEHSRQIDPKWIRFSNRFLEIAEAKDTSPVTRTNAVFGLGVFAKYTPAAFSHFFGQTVRICGDIVHSNKPKSLARDKGQIRSLCDTTCGTLCRLYSGYVQVRAENPQFRLNFDEMSLLNTLYWWLPVKEDEEEAERCYKFFCDRVDANCKLVLGHNFTGLPQLMKLFAQIHPENQFVSSDLARRIRGIIDKIYAAPQEIRDTASQSLTAEEHKSIQCWRDHTFAS